MGAEAAERPSTRSPVEAAAEVPAGAAVEVAKGPVELLEEALRVVDTEPLRAVELALLALRGIKPGFETSSLERTLKAHRARIRLESGEGLRQAVRELKIDLEEMLARTGSRTR